MAANSIGALCHTECSHLWAPWNLWRYLAGEQRWIDRLCSGDRATRGRPQGSIHMHTHERVAAETVGEAMCLHSSNHQLIGVKSM